MNKDTEIKSSNMKIESEVPDGVWLDTRRADAIEWVAHCAAHYSASGPKADDEGELLFPDLYASICEASALGEIDPTCALEAVATALQAVCMSANGVLDEFFREFVGGNVASLFRADAPLKALWVNNVAYPDFSTESLDADDDAVCVEVSVDAIHRVGAMLHNLRREPTGVVADGNSADLAEQWSIGAALSAALDGFVDQELSGEELALLISIPILVITELFDWMDRDVIPGLSGSAEHFLKSELVPNLLNRVDIEEAA